MNNTNPPRIAGVAIPVFSLRSRNDFGAGQFSDLKLLADWAKQTGLSLLQVLPVNDTTSTFTRRDSYPYAAISVFALHPLYLDLTPLVDNFTPNERKLLRSQQMHLNSLPSVDYEQTMALKWKYAQIAYRREGTKLLQTKPFKDFLAQHKDWLVPYAAFCFLRDKYGTADFTQWQDFSVFTKQTIDTLASPDNPDYDQIEMHYYVQYLLHCQLKDTAEYCRSLGIALKGDIPIGIARNSVDAWTAPTLFNMDAQAGAPPDAFSATGQNWGFPTYNWENMARDGYAWWRRRLQAMAEYFDAFRIDHILGFFRIWEIPLHSVHGLLGCFSPALPLSIVEINQRGAWFDADRLCKPYIRMHILKDLFGKYTPDIVQYFFEEYRSQCYQLKDEFNTQRKIEAFFSVHKSGCSDTSDGAATPLRGAGIGIWFPATEEELNSLADKLMSLLNEVVLIEDRREAGRYHPRIAMHYTRSYQELDEEQKRALDGIYIDFFYHRHNDFWRQQALQKLPVIRSATDMLVCGEDLGMVPQCVPEVMRTLNMPGLVIQRMPADSNVEFAVVENAPCLSVCTTGTHDMSGIREWWQEDREVTQRFYNHVLRCDGEAPCCCEDWAARKIVEQHLHSPAALAIFPLQDLLAMDARLRRPNPQEERINVPANPHHYWCYRMHQSIEELLRERGFNEALRGMVVDSGRVGD
jgi:4-alpha-glucanotransferase